MAYLVSPLDDLRSLRCKLRLLRRFVDGHDDLSGGEETTAPDRQSGAAASAYQ